MLCVTRYPSRAWMLPSSIVTGTETTTAFLHSCRTLTRLGSTPNSSATRRSCSLAMSYGFSRRCDSGTSSVVTDAPSALGRWESRRKWRTEYTKLLDRERHLAVGPAARSEEHTSELQSQSNLVCRLLLGKK